MLIIFKITILPYQPLINLIMQASEKLLSSRILTMVLSMILVLAVILLYTEYIPELLVKAEHAIATHMVDIDATIVANNY